ncbi:hypothetical protein BD626DRAFT_515091 [Schizophyllum amplum]|uniref:Uncharacterized protein n=1 Tax=Schizophyllum amplum TaxID=97359 RepID=A0A550BXZ9_9AGAR|nr:hypothetical protein BD626DRAFT_515091 [Auriculariopsis ampla]
MTSRPRYQPSRKVQILSTAFTYFPPPSHLASKANRRRTLHRSYGFRTVSSRADRAIPALPPCDSGSSTVPSRAACVSGPQHTPRHWTNTAPHLSPSPFNCNRLRIEQSDWSIALQRSASTQTTWVTRSDDLDSALNALPAMPLATTVLLRSEIKEIVDLFKTYIPSHWTEAVGCGSTRPAVL